MDKTSLEKRRTIVLVLIFIATAIVSTLILFHQPTESVSDNSSNYIKLPTSTPAALVLNKSEITAVRNLAHNGKDIGQINVKYIDNGHAVFSDLYVVKNIEGKNIILYKITQDGFYRLGQDEFTFNAAKIGGFGGYQLVFIGNDFFIVQEIGADQKQHSRLVSIFWDDKIGQFQSTFTVPKAILEVINGSNATDTGNTVLHFK
jgi:hypothetical protein